MRSPAAHARSAPSDRAAPPQHAVQAAGFTMVEILMTMLLLTVAILGLTALQAATVRQVTLSRQTSEATRLAQSLVEQHQRMPIAAVQTLSPINSWFTLLKRDEASQMVDVGVDGESDGPFTVDRLVETPVVNGVTHYLISIRVSWRNQDVIMTCRRAL